MKICPLITQASILEDKEQLFRESDDMEPAKDGKEKKHDPKADDEIFINPGVKPQAGKSPVEELAPAVPVRFLAKSYRGQVECIGELCRFHDDAASACRFERLLANDGSDVLERIQGLEAKNDSRISELSTGVERKLDDLSSLVRATADEKQKVIEAISLTLDAKTDEIERKIESTEQSFHTFRDEVAGWKGALEKNLETIETGLGEHTKLVRELSDNHTGILQLVESQKKNSEDEDKKRRVSEARRVNNAGVMAYHNGQYEKALGLFQKAIELDAAMTEAYNNLGLTYTEINEEEKATEAFKTAIRLSPELAAAYNNLGYVFYRLGSYEEAIEMYNEAIGRSKDSSSAYTNLGNAYYRLEKVEEAIDAWKKALELDPANEKARRNLKRFHAEVK
ncbi:MAG: tetratricopeptide repeat protein [Candidatus Krumholzibacteriaceae bacterium]